MAMASSLKAAAAACTTSTAASSSRTICSQLRPARRAFSQSSRAAQQSTRGASASSNADDGPRQDRGRYSDDDSGATGKLRGILNSTAAEAALGASAGVILLGLAGMYYHKWYKANTLSKMEQAFDPGYDPVLALAESGGARLGQLAYVRVEGRKEDELIRRILAGHERGRYFLILGPKGSGKTTSIIQAMAGQSADGCAFFEAHPDPSIVVDRFSEAINYTMNRDFLGNLVGLSDLSGMSTFQHLERALHKLETALIRRRQKTGRPAVIVMNATHLLGEGDEAMQILTVLQQRAEKWASAGTATFVFTSNDYFVYDVMRRHSNRMDTLTFKDLNRKQSLDVLRSCRQQYWGEDPKSHDSETLDTVYRITGGRLSILNKVSRRRDMLRAANQLVEDDMHFLLSKRGVIEDCDDDVMDEQKVSSSSWLLFVELVKRQKELEERLADQGDSTQSALLGSPSSSDNDHSAMLSVLPGASTTKTTARTPHASDGRHGDPLKATKAEMAESDLTDPSQDSSSSSAAATTTTTPLSSGAVDAADTGPEMPLASIPWGEARQVMTRADFILPLDHLNLIQIDRHHRIRADSMPLLRAFARVAEVPGYEDKLERVMDRISAIESLGRTRELVWKEQGPEGRFLVKKDARGREVEAWTLLGGDERLGQGGDDGDEDGDDRQGDAAS